MIKRILLLGLVLLSSPTLAEEIRVAVASNFTHALARLAQQFEAETGNKVTLIVGSTGQHYAQIQNGAPFDAFFAADTARPERLDAQGKALPGSRFTYAVGKLVLWHPQGHTLDNPVDFLKQGEFRYLAVANPKLAPYGKAAQEVLQAHDLWGDLQTKMVRGENIGQAYQFVKSSNAEIGFVAYSQLRLRENKLQGAFWDIPQHLYTPIRQQAVLLKEKPAMLAFWDYVKSPDAQQLIREAGYEIPFESMQYAWQHHVPVEFSR